MANLNAVLVTGPIRSGTTLIGRALATASNGFYLHEPFNPDSPWNCAFPLPIHYFHIDEHNGLAYANRYAELLRLEPIVRGQWQDERRNERYRFIERHSALPGRTEPTVLVIKDPIALFSVEWLVRRFHMRPIIVLRDPVAVMSSLVRLNWAGNITLSWMDCQPQLRVRLQQMADALNVTLLSREIWTAHPLYLPAQAARLWYLACLYLTRVAGHRAVSYERLTQDPARMLPPLYQYGGLEPSTRSRQIMAGAEVSFDYSLPHQNTAAPVDAEKIRKKRRESEGDLVDTALIRAVFADLRSGFDAEVAW